MSRVKVNYFDWLCKHVCKAYICMCMSQDSFARDEGDQKKFIRRIRRHHFRSGRRYVLLLHSTFPDNISSRNGERFTGLPAYVAE